MKPLLAGISAVVLLAAVPVADDFVYHGSFLWNDIRAVVRQGDLLFCAFHDGIGTVNLALDFNKKKLYSNLDLDGRPTRLHLFGDLLVAENADRSIALVDVTDPADMVHLGSFLPEFEIFDLACLGHYLYAAVEYYGVVRYDISDPSHIYLEDSSMVGIRDIALGVYDSRLYVLDDYNGIWIYEPDADGFGFPVSRLLLPRQAVSFTVFEDTVYAAIRPNGYLVGTVSDVYNPQYLTERGSYIRGDYLARTSIGLVLANSITGFELIYNGGGMPGELFPIPGIRGYPEVFDFEGRHYIAFPHNQRGFVAYDIDDPFLIDIEYPDFVYAYPGPLNQVAFVNSRLHAVGVNNWYEMYDLSDPSRPIRSGRMINPPYRPAGMCAKGDTVFVADRATNTIFPAVDDGYGDPVSLFPFIGVSDSIERPHLVPGYFNGMDLIYFFNEHRFNASARNDTAIIPNLMRWSFPTGIDAALIDRQYLYQVSNKAVLIIYSIEDDNTIVEVSRQNLPSNMNQMLRADTLFYMAGSRLYTYNMADPLEPQQVGAVDGLGAVYEMQQVDSWLVCAAKNGIFIFDISGGLPQLLFMGGREAKQVAYDAPTRTLAASNGYSIRVYTLPMVDVDEPLPIADEYDMPRLYGYPNPFNPQITLVLENFSSRSDPATVDVFDLLGRRIRRLTVPAHVDGRVSWDGRDEDGHAVPSGVYLFRASQGFDQAAFKAILLK